MKWLALTLVIIFNILFWPSIWSNNSILFSNDSPLGQDMKAVNEIPSAYISVWDDANWLGIAAPSISIGPSGGIRMIAWYLTPWIAKVINAVLLGFLVYVCFFKHVNFRAHILKGTGYLCFTMAAGIIIAMLTGFEHLEHLISLGCITMVFSILTVFSLKEI